MNTQHEESTYALLVRSEEKGRGVLETVLYTLFILSAVFTMWQFAQQRIEVPAAGLQCVACANTNAQVTPHI